MGEVAGVGIANVDYIFTNVSRIPNLGEEVYSEGFSKQLGGGPVATLITLARLGVPVRLGTFVGGGPLSQYLTKELGYYNVSYTNMLATKELDPVNITCVFSTKTDRAFVSYRPDEEAFNIGKEKLQEFYKGSQIAFVSHDMKDMCRPLKEAGTTVVLDSAWDDNMCMEWYVDLLPYVDYFIPNELEALKITGSKTPEEALEVLGQYITNPIIKLGNRGCLLKKNGHKILVPPIEVDHVDSTGAGDIFASGFIYGLYHGYDITDCVRFGNIAGGNAVMKVGCLMSDINEDMLLERHREVYKK
jgi:sugar/nucleoside kinase (ribokinase family)